MKKKTYGIGKRMLALACSVLMIVMMLPISGFSDAGEADSDSIAAADNVASAEEGRVDTGTAKESEPTSQTDDGNGVEADSGNDVNVSEDSGEEVDTGDTNDGDPETVAATDGNDENNTGDAGSAGTDDSEGSGYVENTNPENSEDIGVNSDPNAGTPEDDGRLMVTFDLTDIQEPSDDAKTITPNAEGGYEDYTVTLTVKNDDGKHYRLPDSVKITAGNADLSAEDYTYDSMTGEITIYGKCITGDMTITAKAQQYVTVSLGASTSHVSLGTTQIDVPNAQYQVELTADAGYEMPEEVKVVIGSTELVVPALPAVGSDGLYTYEKNADNYRNGTVTFTALALSGNFGDITITCNGVKCHYEIDPSQPDGNNEWYRQPVTVRPAEGENVEIATTNNDSTKWENGLTIDTDGKYTVYSKASDAKEGQDTGIQINIDMTDPEAKIELATAGHQDGDKLWYKDFPEFTVTFTDNCSGVDMDSIVAEIVGMEETRVTATSTSTKDELTYTCTYSTEGLEAAEDGSYTLLVTVVDKAGNDEDYKSDPVYVDQEAPTITSDYADKKVTYASTDESRNTVYWILKDADFPYTVADADSGLHSVTATVRQNDAVDGTIYTKEYTTQTRDESFNIDYKALGNAGEITKNDITLAAEDNVGNPAEETITVYKDAVIPTVTIETAKEDYKENHEDGDKLWYGDDTTFTVTFSDEGSGVDTDSIDSIKATINNNTVELKEKEGDTTGLIFTCSTSDVAVPADGEYKLKVTVKDNVGNESEEAAATVYVDRKDPVVTVNEIKVEEENKVLRFLTFGIFGNAKITGTVTVTDEAASSGIQKVTMSYTDLDGNQATYDLTGQNKFKIGADYAGTGTYTFSIPVGGNVTEENARVYFNSTVKFQATDNVGRTSAEVTLKNTTENATSDNVMIDTVKPTITSNYADKKVTYAGTDESRNTVYWILKDADFHYTVADADSGLYSVTATKNNVKYEKGSADLHESQTEEENFTIAYADLGDDKAITQNDIALAAEDNAGNVTEEPFTATVYKDAVKPTVTIETETADYTNNDKKWYGGDTTFTVTFSDIGSGVNTKSIDATINDTKVTLTEPKDGTYTCSTSDVAVPANGEYELKVTVKDNVGNTSEKAAATVYVDREDPVVTVLDYKYKEGNDTLRKLTFGIFGNAEITGTVKVEDSAATSGIQKVTMSYTDLDGNQATYDLTGQNKFKIGADYAGTGTYTFSIPVGGNVTEENARVYFNSTVKFQATDNVFRATDSAKHTSGEVTLKNTTENATSDNIMVETVKPTITFNDPDYTTVHRSAYTLSLTVTDPAQDGVYSGLNSVSYSIRQYKTTAKNESVEIGSGSLYSDAGAKQVFDGTISISPSFNSNLVYVVVTAVDNAGNTVEAQTECFKMDNTAPQISVSYDNNNADRGTYFKASRTATITVYDNNFSKDLVSIETGGNILSWSGRDSDGDGLGDTYECQVRYLSDGDYTLRISATDLGGNSTTDSGVSYNGTAPQSFTIDQTVPSISVSYDNNNAANGRYFHEGRTATITIREHNFDISRITVTVTAQNGRKPVTTPSISGWSSYGDTHTATITYDEDGNYTFEITVTDMAGNQDTGTNFGNSEAPTQFAVDLTSPKIVVSGIDNESANNGETIGFVLTVTDMNMRAEDVLASLRAVKRTGEPGEYRYEDVDMSQLLGEMSVTQNGNGETIFIYRTENIPDDGYYYIQCTAVDLAGNEFSAISVENEPEAVASVRFSVNREGSVFWVETEHTLRIGADENGDPIYSEPVYNKLNGAYVNGTVTVVIHEVNIDPVDENPGEETTLILNDGSKAENIELKEGENYIKNSDAKTQENFSRTYTPGTGGSGWYETTYTLDEEQFANDGSYSLNVVTSDTAGNKNINTASESGVISFVVDRTPPVIASNMDSFDLSKAIKINASEYMVEFMVTDLNMQEESLVVTVNGEEIEPTQTGTNTYQFVLKEQNKAQSFTISVRDKAGNESELYSVENATISTNWFVRNKLLFVVILALVVLTAGIIVFLVVRKNKKEKEEVKV